jgi:hypothetical protein
MLDGLSFLLRSRRLLLLLLEELDCFGLTSEIKEGVTAALAAEGLEKSLTINAVQVRNVQPNAQISLFQDLKVLQDMLDFMLNLPIL